MDNLSHDLDMSDGEERRLPQTPTGEELDLIGMTEEQWRAENPRPSGSAPTVTAFPTAPTMVVSRSELTARYEALKRARLQHRIDALEKERQFDEQEAEIQLAAASLMAEGQISQLKKVVDENDKSRKKDRADFDKLSATVKRVQAKVDSLTSRPSRRQTTTDPQTTTFNVQDEIEGIRLEAIFLDGSLYVLHGEVTRPGPRHIVEVGIMKNKAEGLKNEVDALKNRFDLLHAEVTRLSLTSTPANLVLHDYFRHAVKELRGTVMELDNTAAARQTEIDNIVNVLPQM